MEGLNKEIQMRIWRSAYVNVFIATVMIILLSRCSVETTSNSPNVILIMADDMGKETLPSYGNIQNKTPYLDRMANHGILFKNCISQPLCTPSRVKIMTGKYNYRNYEYFGYLGGSEKTFGHLFRENGYATGIAGKWQLNGLAYQEEVIDWKDSTRPIQLGFDEYSLWQLTKLRREGERFSNPLIEQNGEILERDSSLYGPDIFADFILDFIDRKHEEPFFVYYPMVLVHDPFVPTPDSEAWQDEDRRYENDTTYFKDMVAYTDQIVGRILDKLEQHNIAEETIVIFTGDNGTHPSIYSETDSGIIRGGKGNTTNAGTHVPLIIYRKGSEASPFEYEGMIEFGDFYATFAELLGAENTADGKSFLKVIEGDSTFESRKTAFVHYDPKWGKNVNRYRSQFVRDLQYKLYSDDRFYFLEEDPLEEQNLLDRGLSLQQRTVYDKLRDALEKHPTLLPLE